MHTVAPIRGRININCEYDLVIRQCNFHCCRMSPHLLHYVRKQELFEVFPSLKLTNLVFQAIQRCSQGDGSYTVVHTVCRAYIRFGRHGKASNQASYNWFGHILWLGWNWWPAHSLWNSDNIEERMGRRGRWQTARTWCLFIGNTDCKRNE